MHMSLGQITKQPLSNFESQTPWKYKQLWGLWGLTLVAYEKIVLIDRFKLFWLYQRDLLEKNFMISLSYYCRTFLGYKPVGNC